jgi:hypothetical protein
LPDYSHTHNRAPTRACTHRHSHTSYRHSHPHSASHSHTRTLPRCPPTLAATLQTVGSPATSAVWCTALYYCSFHYCCSYSHYCCSCSWCSCQRFVFFVATSTPAAGGPVLCPYGCCGGGACTAPAASPATAAAPFARFLLPMAPFFSHRFRAGSTLGAFPALSTTGHCSAPWLSVRPRVSCSQHSRS